MKKRLRILALLLVAWLVVPWTLSAAVYLSENFNGLSSGIPEGWDNSKSGDNPAGNPWTYTNEGYDGTGAMKFDSWNNAKNSDNYLMTPVINPGAQCMLVFKANTHNACEKGDFKLLVYVTKDDGVTLTDISGGGICSPEWEEFSFGYNNTDNSSIRFVFYAKSTWDTYNGYRIDDIVVKDPPACAQPVELSVNNVGQTAATLAWKFASVGAESTSLKLTVNKVDATGTVLKTVKIEEPITSLTKSYEITGLEPLARYEVILVSDCSSEGKGSSDPSKTLYFYTAAGPMTLPVEESFTGARVGDYDVNRDLILGWSFSPSTDNATVDIYADGSETDGTKKAALQLVSNQNADGYVITPQIAHPINDLQITLKVKGYNSGDKLVVGAIDNATAGIEEFDAFDTITISKNDQWQEFRVNSSKFTAYDDEVDHQLAFKAHYPGGDSWKYVWIDDIKIEDCPACPRIENVAVESVDSVSVVLKYFTYSPDAAVNVCLTEDMTADAQTLTPVATSEANVYTVTVKNLKSNTGYNLRLRSACSETEIGEWSLPVSVTTLCGPRQGVMFKEEFSGFELPGCWFSEGVPDQWGNAPRWYVEPDWETEGAYYLKASASNGKSTQLYIQSLPIAASEASVYDVSFRMKREEANNDRYPGMEEGVPDEKKGLNVYVSNKPSLSDATLVDFVPLNYELAPAESLPGWYTYECNIELTGNVFIIFDANASLTLDDVEVKLAPACRNPKYIVMGEPTASDVKMSWRADKKQSKWSVNYTLTSLSGEGAPKSETKDVLTVPEFTFTGLTASTRYRVKGTITADCGAEKSAAVPFSFEFETPCPDYTALPFVEKFDEELFIPLCWRQNQVSKGYSSGGMDINYRDTAWIRNVQSEYVADGAGSAILRAANNNATTDLISPRIVLPETGKYRLTFYMLRDSRTTNDRLDVYVSDTREADYETPRVFSAYANRRNDIGNNPMEAADGFYKYYVDIADTLRGARHFIFRGVTEGDDLFVDEVTVSQVASCDYVDGAVSFDSIRHNAVRVYVSDQSVKQFEVEYGACGFEIGTGTRKLLSTDNPVLDGLTAETDYDVYVRRYCDAANQGEWTQRVARFSTLSNPYEVTLENEFFDDFEKMNNGQSVGNPYIHDYYSLVTGEEPVEVPFEGMGAYLPALIYPEDGRRFIQTPAGVNTRVLVPMQLKAGHNYEISAIMVQDNPDVNLAEIQFLHVTSLESDESQVNIGVHKIGQGWKFVHNFFSVSADGVYYVGWNAKVKNPTYILGIDNFRVREVECVPPMTSAIKVENITNNSASLSWDGEGETWDVMVSTVAGTEDLTNVFLRDTVDSKKIDLTGLAENTQYYYYISSICAGNKPSVWSDEASFRTNCATQTIPLVEDFEDPALIDFGCWKVTNGTVERNLSTAHAGEASLLAKGANMVSPQLDVTTLNGNVLTGWAYSIVDDMEFVIGVQNDLTNIASYTMIATVKVQKAKRWTPFVVSFDILGTEKMTEFANAKYVVINSPAENLWFDDIAIVPEGTCPQPTNPVINYTSGSTVQLSWDENGTATSWRVEMRRGGLLSFDTVVDNTNPVIKGLAPITEYEVYVASVCGEGSESELTEIGMFSSGCAPLPLPYVQKFGKEYYPYEYGNTMPDCWEVTESTGEGSDIAWYANLPYGYFGYSSMADGQYSILRTPFFNLTTIENPALDVECEVNAYTEDECPAKCEFMISTDGGKIFYTLQTVTKGNKLDSTIDLSVYAEMDNVCFAFKAYSAIYYNGMYDQAAETRLSRFAVTGEEACARPTNLRYVGSSESEVAVAITGTSASYEVVCGNVGIDPNSEKLTVIPFTSTIDTITGLAAATTYDIYVRGVCEDGSKSLWEGPLNVTTAKSKLAYLPYAESFETYESANELLPDVSHGEVGSSPRTGIYEGPVFASDGNKGLVLEIEAGNPWYGIVGKPVVYRLPAFGVDLNTLVLEYDYHHQDGFSAPNAPDLVLGLVTPDFDLSSFSLNSDVLPNEGFVALETMKYTTSFVHVKYSFANIPEEYNDYRIVLYAKPKNDYQSIYVDNIRVRVDESCPMVIQSVVDTAVTTASFKIVASSKAAGIQLAYGLAGTAPKNCTIIDVTADTTLIQGLTEATTYFVFARGVCDGGETSEWSTPLTITTACADITVTEDAPYFENFDMYEDMVVPFPPCVNVVKSDDRVDGTVYPTLSAVKSISEPRALLLRGNSMLALPELVGVDLAQTIISFDVIGAASDGVTGSAPFKVGLLDKLGEEHKFTEIGTYLYGTGDKSLYARELSTHYEIDLTLDTLDGEYFAFSTESQYSHGYVYIDNVKVELAPTCYEPRGLKTTLVMDTALAFEWRAAPDATLFHYELRQGRSTVVREGDVTETNVTFKDLKPNTPYTLYVRTVCDYTDAEDDTTKYATMETTTFRRFGRIPYEYGFEDDQKGDTVSDWYRPGADNNVTNVFTIDSKATQNDDKTRFGSKSLYITEHANNGDYTYGAGWGRTSYAYRTFYLEPGKYSISYDWKANGRKVTIDEGGEKKVETCIDFARVFFAPISYNIQNDKPERPNGEGGGAYMIPKGAIMLDTADLMGQEDWIRMNKLRFNVTDAGMYNLVVAWSDDDSDQEPVGTPIAIDNIVLENQDLEMPADLTLVTVKSDSAKFTWTSQNDTFAVRVYDVARTLILRDTVYGEKEYTVGELNAASEYTFEVRAQHPYGNRTYISEWAEMPFVTECVIADVPYIEDFEGMVADTFPLCWNSNDTWGVLKAFNGSDRMNLDVSALSGKAEFTSPAFVIPEGDNKTYHLSFAYYNNTAADSLKVMVGNYHTGVVKEVMSEGMKTDMFTDRWISLAEYAGDTIQFSFVANVKDKEINHRISIDDFRISCVSSEVESVEDEECFSEATMYDRHGFKLTLADIAFGEGENQVVRMFDRLVKGATDADCDHIFRLNLTAGRGAHTEVRERICKGQTYVSEAFPKGWLEEYPDGIDEAGTYHSITKMETAAGCDSTVTLYLEVYEIAAEIVKTICEGDYAEFNGVKYYESIELSDTTENANGCDSVTHFRLTVQPKEYVTKEYVSSCKPSYRWEVDGKTYNWDEANPNDTLEVVVSHKSVLGCDSNYVLQLISLPKERVTKATVCQGLSYTFGKHVIENPETKRYEFDGKDETNCDFKDILDLTVTVPDTTHLTDYICQDHRYTDNGFDITATKDTVAYLYTETLEGCDSVVKIALDFIETIVVDTTIVIKDGESYEFDGRDLVEAGEYQATFEAVSTGCDSVVNLTLVVTVGVDNVMAMPLVLAPNPVRTGEVTYVHHDWTTEEQNGLKVEVINSVGQTISVNEPDSYPIAVNGIEVSGVYYIRITTGTGDVYLGKLVVK